MVTSLYDVAHARELVLKMVYGVGTQARKVVYVFKYDHHEEVKRWVVLIGTGRYGIVLKRRVVCAVHRNVLQYKNWLHPQACTPQGMPNTLGHSVRRDAIPDDVRYIPSIPRGALN